MWPASTCSCSYSPDVGDSAEEPIPVAIETNRGLLVACLRTTGRQVYAINPKAVDRCP